MTLEEAVEWREKAFWRYFDAVANTQPQRPATPALAVAVIELDQARRAVAALEA